MSKAKEEEEEDFLRRVERALSVLTFHVPDTYWRKEAKELREELQEILLRR